MMIDVFFYGLFMDENVLREKGVHPLSPRRAVVSGYKLAIGERAWLLPQFGSQTFGMVFALDSREAESLYAEPGLDGYRAESVLVAFERGTFAAVTTFNLDKAHRQNERNIEYVLQLQELLERLGFPAGSLQNEE